MSKKPKEKGLTRKEFAELIIKAVVAAAALIQALKSRASTRWGRKPRPLVGVSLL